jgi:hypothetical protein
VATQPGRLLVQVSAGVIVAAGLGLAALRFGGEAPPARGLEAAIGAAALGLVIATPGVLALLALRDRPALLLPAAALLVPLSFLSFALVTLPLLIPAVLLARAFARAAPDGASVRTAITTLLVLALLATALLTLFIHDDSRQFTTATASYSTSDVITYWEAARSMTFSAAAVVVGWHLSPMGTPQASPLRHHS